MKNYIGIDLGTTNSAVSAYDGENLRLFKSPDQNDVTPSAIFIDKRGNRYVGKRAYDNAARNPENAATLFKRLMGTSTPVKLPAVDLTMTPEECSAEILRVREIHASNALRCEGALDLLDEQIRALEEEHPPRAGSPAPHEAGLPPSKGDPDNPSTGDQGEEEKLEEEDRAKFPASGPV